MIEENLFVYAEWSSVKHAASWFSVKKKCPKKKKKKKKRKAKNESDTRSCQFFIQKFHALHYADSTYSYKTAEYR